MSQSLQSDHYIFSKKNIIIKYSDYDMKLACSEKHVQHVYSLVIPALELASLKKPLTFFLSSFGQFLSIGKVEALVPAVSPGRDNLNNIMTNFWHPIEPAELTEGNPNSSSSYFYFTNVPFCNYTGLKFKAPEAELIRV
jgi:hypothetical protein